MRLYYYINCNYDPAKTKSAEKRIKGVVHHDHYNGSGYCSLDGRRDVNFLFYNLSAAERAIQRIKALHIKTLRVYMAVGEDD